MFPRAPFKLNLLFIISEASPIGRNCGLHLVLGCSQLQQQLFLRIFALCQDGSSPPNCPPKWLLVPADLHKNLSFEVVATLGLTLESCNLKPNCLGASSHCEAYHPSQPPYYKLIYLLHLCIPIINNALLTCLWKCSNALNCNLHRSQFHGAAMI